MLFESKEHQQQRTSSQTYHFYKKRTNKSKIISFNKQSFKEGRIEVRQSKVLENKGTKEPKRMEAFDVKLYPFEVDDQLEILRWNWNQRMSSSSVC